jgi:hypothetical protein
MAPAYGSWYKSGGEIGEGTDGDLQRSAGPLRSYKVTVDGNKQIEIGKQIVRKATENLFCIARWASPPALTVVKNTFHNSWKNTTSDWIVFTPGTMDPPQFWMEQ